LLDIIKKEKPSKIFTHSPDDFHHDHRAVHRIVKALVAEHKLTKDIYTFDVWNPLKLLKRNVPKLVVDISDTFKKKLEAYEAHESQVNLPGMLPFRVRMWIDAILYGWSNQCRYAELFYKL
jgi:LmbE family N-acetylglucosaminyl deacetylase